MNAQRPVKPAPTGNIVTVHEAKTHLSRLLARVEAGEEIVIARGSVPVARISALTLAPAKRRVPNRFAHEVEPGRDVLDDGFWDPLPDEYLGLGPDDERLLP